MLPSVPRAIIEEHGLSPNLTMLTARRLRLCIELSEPLHAFVSEILSELDYADRRAKIDFEDLTFTMVRELPKAAEACEQLGPETGDEVVRLAVCDCAHEYARLVWCVVNNVDPQDEYWEKVACLQAEHPKVEEIIELTRRIAGELGVEW